MAFEMGQHVHWIDTEGLVRTGTVVIAHPGMTEVTVHVHHSGQHEVVHPATIAPVTGPPVRR